MSHQCIKCDVNLVLDKNWFSSCKKYSKYICKSCFNKDKRNTYKTNKTLLIAIKDGSSCAICGYWEYPEALDFHHIEPTNKKYEIQVMALQRDDLIVELNKCMILCRNCHAHVEKVTRDAQ